LSEYFKATGKAGGSLLIKTKGLFINSAPDPPGKNCCPLRGTPPWESPLNRVTQRGEAATKYSPPPLPCGVAEFTPQDKPFPLEGEGEGGGKFLTEI